MSRTNAGRVAGVGLQISPSILTADFAHLADELDRISDADWAHVDVMDNHFVPNLTLGLPVVESMVKAGPLPVDTHLMIEDPDRWAPGYAEAGARSVTFHAEAAQAPVRLARELRRLGARAGIALRPATPGRAVPRPAGGVRHGPGDDRRARLRRAEVPRGLPAQGAAGPGGDRRGGLDVWVQVDGGVSEETIAHCAEAGADVFVAGSAVYGADDAAAAILKLRELAAGDTRDLPHRPRVRTGSRRSRRGSTGSRPSAAVWRTRGSSMPPTRTRCGASPTRSTPTSTSPSCC